MHAFSIKRIIAQPLPDLKPVDRYLVKIFMLFFIPFLKVENVMDTDERHRAVIYAFNHNRSLETLVVAAFLLFVRKGRPVRFIIDWMYGWIPLLGNLFNRVKPIYVYNKPARFRWLNKRKPKIIRNHVYEQSVVALKNDVDIALFPEGTRNRDPERLKRGRSGIGRMVLESGCAVLPIGIDFTDRGSKKWYPLFGKIILRIGSICTFSKEIDAYIRLYEDLSMPDAERKRRIRDLSSQVTTSVMKALARLSGKQYPFDINQPSERNNKEETCHAYMP